MSYLGDLIWMLPPLAICLVLTGIHGYLGIHVISRKVIFVDLALAQIAALGSTYALILGYDPREPNDAGVVYLCSLGFTIAGAAVFALTRMRHEKVPQEAFIGIVYAVASAVAILLLAKAPGETEHIKEMLVGNVLLVRWPEVLKTAGIYSVIGTFHYLARRPFFEISTDPEGALARGRRVRLWDFAFYASFGLVITSSVAVAGVLLVFSFLVVPAVIAFMFQEGLRARIVLAWLVGTACSAAGMLLSYHWDLPTGPSVVASFAVLLLLAALAYFVRASPRPLRAMGQVVGGGAMLAAIAGLTLIARKAPEEHVHESEFEQLASALSHGEESAQIEAIHHLAKYPDPHAVEQLVKVLRDSRSDRVREHVLEVLPELGPAASGAVPALEQLSGQLEDPFLRFAVAEALFRLRSPAGFGVLRRLLEEEPPALLADRAEKLLETITGVRFGVAETGEEARAQALQKLDRWLSQRGPRLRWRPERQRFE